MKASELAGRTLLEVFPQTEPYWMEKFEEVIITGLPARFEQYSKELGAYTELNIYSPQDGQLAMTSVDISDRKITEDLLHQTRINYETFFNTIDDFLFVLDEQGNIIHTNNTVIDRLGYTGEELAGKSVLMTHPPERREEAGRIVGEMLSGTAEFCPVPVITKAGIQIPVETRVK